MPPGRPSGLQISTYQASAKAPSPQLPPPAPVPAPVPAPAPAPAPTPPAPTFSLMKPSFDAVKTPAKAAKPPAPLAPLAPLPPPVRPTRLEMHLVCGWHLTSRPANPPSRYACLDKPPTAGHPLTSGPANPPFQVRTTRLTLPADAGDTRIHVLSRDYAEVGMKIVIGDGPFMEMRSIAGFGSILLDAPLVKVRLWPAWKCCL